MAQLRMLGRVPIAAHIVQDSFGISRAQPRRCRRFSTLPAGRQNLLCRWLPVPRLAHSVVSPQSSQPRSEPRISPLRFKMSQARPNKAPEPTAVSAVSNSQELLVCIDFSRRWLSFYVLMLALGVMFGTAVSAVVVGQDIAASEQAFTFRFWFGHRRQATEDSSHQQHRRERTSFSTR